MQLSIVIVNWNTRQLLADCLSSIEQTAGDLAPQIIVVDNASTDDSAEMLQTDFPNVTVIQNMQNVGFAAANNQAIRHCTGNYVLLLNSDTVVYPDSLQQLVAYLDEHPRVGAVGPRLLNQDGSLQPSCHPFHTPNRELWRMAHGELLLPKAEYEMHGWSKTEARQVDVIKGACILLRRDALEQVHLLDESFYFYSEEVDLCYRLYQAGWQLVWLPTPTVLHYGGASTKLMPLKMFHHLYDGKLVYFRKHYGRLAGWYYKLVLLFMVGMRLLLTPAGVLFRPKQRQRYLTLSNYYIHLLIDLPSM